MMGLLSEYNGLAAATLARVFLGLLFFFQGYDAAFRIGLGKVIQTYEDGFKSAGIPRFLVVAAAWFTISTELFGGVLLVLGVLEFPVLYLLGLNLLVAATGFGIVTPMWDTKHVFPRLILLLFLLVIPAEWNAWSLDHLILNR
jgi:putative oxidoreductase